MMSFLPLKQILQQHHYLPHAPEVALHPHLHEEILLYQEQTSGHWECHSLGRQFIASRSMVYIFEVGIVSCQPQHSFKHAMLTNSKISMCVFQHHVFSPPKQVNLMLVKANYSKTLNILG